MSEVMNLPAKTFPTAQEFQMIKELAKMAISSGFLPTAVNTPEKAVIIILKGRELGIQPMNAFSSIAVVNGKPTMSSELMLSMIYRNVPGAVVNYVQNDAEKCVIEAQRPGGKISRFSFSMDDAKRANLTGKGPWVTYPAAMLRARCVSAMARAMFPDALSGVVYTPEELGASVTEDGEVIDIPEVGEPSFHEPQLPAADSTNIESAWDYRLPNHWQTNGGKTLREIGEDEVKRILVWLKGPRSQDTPLNQELKFYCEQALKSREFENIEDDGEPSLYELAKGTAKTIDEAVKPKMSVVEISPSVTKPFCRKCKTEMKISQAGTSYFCPNFRQGGSHSRFSIQDLDRYLRGEI